MIFAAGTLRANFRDNRCQGCETPSIEFAGRQYSCPAIEDLHGLDAGFELADEIGRRCGNQFCDQGFEKIRMSVGEQPRGSLIGCSVAGDHIARHSPRCAAKADETRLGGKHSPHPVDGFEYRSQSLAIEFFVQAREVVSASVSGRAAARCLLRRKPLARVRRG